jgi:hypothetical protein
MNIKTREWLPELPVPEIEQADVFRTAFAQSDLYTADQMRAYAIAALSQPAQGGGEAFYHCEDCGTGEVDLTRTCHNSACGHYAQGTTVYEGWDAALPRPQPEKGAKLLTDQRPRCCEKAVQVWEVCADCLAFNAAVRDAFTPPPPRDEEGQP